MKSSNESLTMPAAASNDVLTDVLRDGAERLLAQALQPDYRLDAGVPFHAMPSDQGNRRRLAGCPTSSGGGGGDDRSK